jgi:hypothetical protein
MKSAAERFWSRVDKSGECWTWTGMRDPHGYGRVGFAGKASVLVHRVAFYLEHGRWPKPCALHSCDNPSCARPAHLREGSQTENIRDRDARGRTARGAANGRTKLSELEKEALISYARKFGSRAAGRYFKIDGSYASKLVRGIRRAA